MNTQEIHWFTQAHKYWSLDNDFSSAEKMLNKCIKANPFNGKALISKVLLLIMSNKKNKALNITNSILSVNPDDMTVKELKEVIISNTLDISLIHTQHFFIIQHKITSNNELALKTGKILEKGFSFIQKITKCNFTDHQIIIEINDKYRAFPSTQFIARPLIKKIALAGEDCNEGTLIHELVHALVPTYNKFLSESLALYIQSIFSNIPSWPFNIEDFNQLRTKKIPEIDLLCDYIFDLKYFTLNNFISGKSLEYYKQAFVFSKYLIEKHGIYNFLKFYNELKDGEPSIGAEKIYLNIYNEPLYNKNELKVKRMNKSEQSVIYEKEYNEIKKTDIQKRLKNWTDFQSKLSSQLNDDPNIYSILFRAGINSLFIKFDEIGIDKLQKLNILNNELNTLKDEIKEAVVKYPEYGEFNMCLAEAYCVEISRAPSTKQGQIYFKIQKEINTALKKEPENLIIILSYCRILIFTPEVFGGNPEEAKIILDEILLEQPENEDAVTWDIYCDYKLNNHKSAEIKLDKILKKNPNNYIALKLKNIMSENK